MTTWTIEIRPEFNPTFREPYRKIVSASSLTHAVRLGLVSWRNDNRGKRLTEATIKVRKET